MKIDTGFTMYVREDLPTIEYGRSGETEWLTMEDVTMFISKRGKKVLGQLITNLNSIYINLEDEEVAE